MANYSRPSRGSNGFHVSAVEGARWWWWWGQGGGFWAKQVSFIASQACRRNEPLYMGIGSMYLLPPSPPLPPESNIPFEMLRADRSSETFKLARRGAASAKAPLHSGIRVSLRRRCRLLLIFFILIGGSRVIN